MPLAQQPAQSRHEGQSGHEGHRVAARHGPEPVEHRDAKTRRQHRRRVHHRPPHVRHRIGQGLEVNPGRRRSIPSIAVEGSPGDHDRHVGQQRGEAVTSLIEQEGERRQVAHARDGPFVAEQGCRKRERSEHGPGRPALAPPLAMQ